ncbi:hypothetical protein HSBAA_22940 [Vreelandella sulfidaeris]|uniref:Uncharacterized protein n=1 Tax=Vreelandella sulfidaeris TaxID=115553 RepID=A0A455U9Q5_9GAMM|nr:hypothetical protein HSBAA_22940 [Halomonas sulfidaeris]
MRSHSLPFPVRAPFGVDMNTAQLERPFTPGGELSQQVKALALLAIAKFEINSNCVAA